MLMKENILGKSLGELAPEMELITAVVAPS